MHVKDVVKNVARIAKFSSKPNHMHLSTYITIKTIPCHAMYQVN